MVADLVETVRTAWLVVICIPLGMISGYVIAQAVARSTELHGGRAIPSRPATQLMATILFCLVGLRVGENWAILPLLTLVSVLLGVSIIDWSHQRIPNRAIKPAFVGSALMLLLISLLSETGSIQLGILGAATFSGLLGAIHLCSPRGMGMGDVRLAALLGLFIGWTSMDVYDAGWSIGVALLLASVLGIASAVLIHPLRSRNQKTLRGIQVPFGPALSVATTLVVLSSV